MATITCSTCGRETEHAFDGDYCAVCHLYHLSAIQESRTSVLRMIDVVIRDAIMHEGVHPDDVRGLVESTLAGTDFPARQRLEEVRAELRAHERVVSYGMEFAESELGDVAFWEAV